MARGSRGRRSPSAGSGCAAPPLRPAPSSPGRASRCAGPADPGSSCPKLRARLLTSRFISRPAARPILSRSRSVSGVFSPQAAQGHHLVGHRGSRVQLGVSPRPFRRRSASHRAATRPRGLKRWRAGGGATVERHHQRGDDLIGPSRGPLPAGTGLLATWSVPSPLRAPARLLRPGGAGGARGLLRLCPPVRRTVLVPGRYPWVTKRGP